MIATVSKTEPFDCHFAGRAEAGFPHEKKDCTVRSTASAWGITYAQAHALLKKDGRKDGKGHSTSRFMKQGAVKQLGDHYEVTPIYKRRRVFTFLRCCNPALRYLVTIRGHVFAVINGRVQDNVFSEAQNCLVKRVWVVQPKLDRPGAINLPVLVRK